MTSLADGTDITAISRRFVTAGKWYWEINAFNLIGTIYQSFGIGLADVDFTNTTRAGWLESWAWMGNGRYYHDGSYSVAPTYSDDTILMFALDATLGRLWYGANGVWNGTGNPATNTDPIVDDNTMIGQNIYIVGTLRRPDDSVTLRVSTDDFSYSIPSGFSAIRTS